MGDRTFQEVAKDILDSGMPLWEAERRFRDAVELEALNRTQGHQLKAAALLGVHRNTLGRGLAGSALRKERPAPVVSSWGSSGHVVVLPKEKWAQARS
jgi:DNA-binding NtrC family response regulator